MAQLRAKQIKLAADGDLIIGGASGNGQVLTKGTAGQVLKVLTGGALGYEKAAAADTTFTSAEGITATNVAAALDELKADLDELSGGGSGTSLSSLQIEADHIEAQTGVSGAADTVSFTAPSLSAQTNLKAAIEKNATDTAAAQTEIDAVETAVGLNADGTKASWTSMNYVESGDSFAGAINHIDAKVHTALVDAAQAIADEEADRIAADAQEVIDRNAAIASAVDAEELARQNADQAIQDELDATQVGAGLAEDGTYAPKADANYIQAATSLKDADEKLDAALKAEAGVRAAGDSALQNELDATQAGAGLSTAGAYVADEDATYISTATTLSGADLLLDAAVKAVADQVAEIAGGGGSSISSLQAEINSIEEALGFNEDGTKPTLAQPEGTHFGPNATIIEAVEGLDSALATAESDIDALELQVQQLAGLGALHFVGTVNGDETDTAGITPTPKNGSVYRVTTTAAANWAGTGIEVNVGDYVVVTDITANSGAGAWVKFDNTDPTIAAAAGETALVITGGTHEGFQIALTKKALTSTSTAIVVTGGTNSTLADVSLALDASKINFAALGDAGAPGATQDGKFLKWNNTTKQVEYVTAGQLGATVKVDEDFTPAAASNVVVTLTAAPVGDVTVFMNGVKLKKSGFIVAGSTVTLQDANNGYPYEDGDVLSVTYTRSAA